MKLDSNDNDNDNPGRDYFGEHVEYGVMLTLLKNRVESLERMIELYDDRHTIEAVRQAMSIDFTTEGWPHFIKGVNFAEEQRMTFNEALEQATK